MGRIRVDLADPDPRAVEEIVAAVLRGSILVYPTDTIYGLGCDALHDEAVARLNRLKLRDPERPLLMLIPDAGWVGRLARDVPPGFAPVRDAFWPGPLTLILRAGDAAPRAALGAGDTIGLRWSDSLFLDRVLTRLQRPLISTSANLSGRPPVRDPGAESDPILQEVELIVDAGPLEGAPSTLLDLSGTQPRILREGAVPRRELERLLGPC